MMGKHLTILQKLSFNKIEHVFKKKLSTFK